MRRANTEQEYSRASNAVHHIGTNAVPFLLQMVRATNRPPEQFRTAFFLAIPLLTDESSVRVSLACRALGSQANPIISELTNRLRSADENEAKVAATTLLNTGAGALCALMEFYASPDASSTPLSIPKRSPFSSSEIVTVMSTNPKELLPAMIRVYERGNAKIRTEAERFLRFTFLNDLGAEREDVAFFFPVLKPNLQSSESFIRSEILAYLRRCGPNAKAAVPEVKKLLSDTDPTVRLEATNALAAIESQK